MSWPTVEDLADYLQLDIAELDDIHAEAALRSAKARIVAYTRQAIELVEDDEVTVEATGRAIFLPEVPVLSVSEVVANGTTLASTSYALNGATGVLYRVDGSWWESERANRFAPSLVTVTYSHGRDPIPEPAFDVCLALAARHYNSPSDGMASETIGNYSYKADSEGPDLDDEEMAMLGAYRLVTVA